MAVLDFIINEIFGSAPIFLSLIAFLGLLLQRKSFPEVLSGTFKTALGVVILTKGVDIIIGAILPLLGAFGVFSGDGGEAIVSMGSAAFMNQYGSSIGIAMVSAFAINLLVARFTKWKAVFLTGHMLYWFPFIFVAAGVDAGLSGVTLVLVATLFTAAYMVITPNIIRPFVKEVTKDDSFTLGHPTVGLSLIAGYIGKWFGDKSKSTEDLKFSKNLSFLKEISITSSIVIVLVYGILMLVLTFSGQNALEVFGVASTAQVFRFLLTQGLAFGAGLTVLLLGVRMMIAEIVPAFTGFQEKLIPDAIPALDCPLLFPYAPNALIIGFVVSMISSTAAIVLLAVFGVFPYVIAPLTITCFFEIGTASIIGNATGGRRGAILGSAVAGVVMVLLVAFSIPFLQTTVADWIVIFGGNDFSLWAIIQGLFARLLA
ncbi:MAG: PTS ascorbate transporter subunit IIC [Erysipelotrichia bacterium]|jgi:PTS system ascorbate-specific IIC component|nr:PTS ascorbate transporter subunit IIC [Erysipelotrichia bacterium]